MNPGRPQALLDDGLSSLLAKPGDRRDPSPSTSFAGKGGWYARIGVGFFSAVVVLPCGFSCGRVGRGSQSQSGGSASCSSGGGGSFADWGRKQGTDSADDI